MHDGGDNRPLTLADYVEILRRRKWVIVQAAIIAPVIAVLVAVGDPTVYRASADVLVNRQYLGSQLVGIQDPTAYQDPNRLLRTQADLANVPAVARRAAEIAKLPGITAAVFSGSTSVAVRKDADLLSFAAVSRDAATAAAMANAFARAFTEYRRELDTAALSSAQKSLRKRLTELRRKGREDSALFANLVDKEQQLRTLELLQASNIVVRPATGAAKKGPPVRRNGILGGIFGLIIGMALAFLWEALDRRVRSASELERVLKLQVLGKLPEPPRRLWRERRLVMVEEPRTGYSEVFRRLRMNFEFVNAETDAQTVMITSAVKREGKSTTIANLAVALARAGRRVVLIDLDLRQPLIASFFRLDRRWGVAEVARGRAELDDVIVPVPMPHNTPRDPSSNGGDDEGGAALLEVVPAGLVLPSDPGEFVQSAALNTLLERLRERADIVLIDAPPLLVVGDAMALAPRVDALLTVARIGVIRRPALQELARALDVTPVPKLGLIVTGSPSEETYGYGGYGYYEPEGARPAEQRRTPAR